MTCPHCDHKAHLGVLETRRAEKQIYRRKFCGGCGHTHWTVETLHQGPVSDAIRRPAKKEKEQTALTPRKSPWDILMEKRK